MAIDFPNSPTNGQVFTTTKGAWQWDGTKWVAQTLFVPQGNANVFISDTAPASPDVGDLWYDSVGAQLYVWYSDANSTQWVVVVNQNSASLLLSGGTLTGPLILAADPTVALGAATMQYVENSARYKNRIVNGDMSVDQRNQGSIIATPAVATSYAIDRWKYISNIATSHGSYGQNPNTAGGGISYPYCLTYQTTSAYALAASDFFQYAQNIEGYNFNDAQFGTSAASSLILEFWAYTTVAGTYAGALSNPGATRSYVFTYTLAAGVWTKIVINIPGDTAGTWAVASNAAALTVHFTLAVGTTFQTTTPNVWQSANVLGVAGAVSVLAQTGSFFITGVGLMVGAPLGAKPEFRKYSDNLFDCKRYFQTLAGILSSGYTSAAGVFYNSYPLPTVMRTSPTALFNTINYYNASNLIINSVNPTQLMTATTITATGYGYAGFNVNFDADF